MRQRDVVKRGEPHCLRRNPEQAVCPVPDRFSGFPGGEIFENRQTGGLISLQNHPWNYLQIVAKPLAGAAFDGTVSLATRVGGGNPGWHEAGIAGHNWCDTFIPEHNRKGRGSVSHRALAGKAEKTGRCEVISFRPILIDNL